VRNSVLNKINASKKLFAPGVQKPIYLLNFVTNRCNAACDHCFYWQKLNTDKKQELSVEENEKIAKSLGSMLQINFTGGSPELRNDLPEIVYKYYENCHPLNITICMLGYNTEKILEHTNKILNNCKGQQITIAISLDGLKEEHNKLRKLNGLFDRVVNTINELNMLRKYYSNLRIDIGMVVHGLNIETVEKSAIWVRENLPIDKLKPILVRGNPLNPNTRDNKCIDLYERIIDRDYQWLMHRTQNKMTIIDKVIRAKEIVQRDIIRKISQTNISEIKCSGGRETAVLYPTGDVAGCELRNNILGNIREWDYNFKDIWLSQSAKQFRNTTGNVKECVGCYHHCFLSPAIFRTPSIWTKIVKSILKLM